MPTRRFSRILVVEDSPADLQLLCDILEGEGFQVIGCGSATEALRRIQDHQVGVAVVDLRLPDLSGTQLLEKIREFDNEIRVIIYTGAASYASIKEALNLGAFAYVEKLSDPSELLRHIHRAFCERVDRYALDLEQAVAERTEKLARSNYDLEKFAFVVAHDLRSPLLTISGYSQILQEEYADRLDANADEYLSQIVEGVERMNRMIEDLLHYSRAGRSDDPLEQVDVQSVLTQTLANLEATIEEQGARIEIDPMPTVLGEQTQLVQLFQNLIDNAVKFHRDVGPTVRVTGSLPWPTTELALPRSISIDCLTSSSVCRAANIPARASDWPSAKRSSSGTAGASGSIRPWGKARRSILPCRRPIRRSSPSGHCHDLARE
jgi:signal transduction histidine kinase